MVPRLPSKWCTFWTWAGAWNGVTPSTPCTGCFDQPDASQAFNSSWHDGALISGSCAFQGSAIYIYGIDAVNPANISFSTNGAAPVTGFHYNSVTGCAYDALFFAATGLDPAVQHTVTWSLEKSANGGTAALFDYAKVTVDQTAASNPSVSSPASSTLPPAVSAKHKPKRGTIVGAVVGGVGALTLLGAALLIFWRRRRHTSRTVSIDLDADEHTAPLSRGAASYGYSPVSTGTSSELQQPAPAPSSAVFTGDPSETETAVGSSESPRPPPNAPTSTPKVPPVMLAWDPSPSSPDSTGGRARDLIEMEERLRHLEALAQPPAYA
ncbi:hypothetical protein B0H17DRAFT_1204139 [Mycena rosella]|uniref:Uncharacterized protein n=1 Tax=Mycena rosella TaxID=1033263 RepID=A0AAD7GGB5_MYCRO|nr:hypothetical protein B0H17DRAFT_1204139 [Mycena rosella]